MSGPEPQLEDTFDSHSSILPETPHTFITGDKTPVLHLECVYDMSQGQQVLILREDSSRSRGRDARSRHIMVTKSVAETVRSTMGARAMDKLLAMGRSVSVITTDVITHGPERQREQKETKQVV